MTSANVTEYRIEDLAGKTVGSHSQHCYCKTHWGDLLKFTPAENFIITPHGLDEEEEEWESEPINLKTFIERLEKGKATFNTMADLMKPFKKA
jgi:hypothetical protein